MKLHLPLGQFQHFLEMKMLEDSDGVLDDDIPDAFEAWVVEVDVDDWIKYGNEYATATHEDTSN